jgi:hypothetical protein
MTELELAHFGIKGMHWGQHKAQAKTVAVTTGRAVKKASVATAKGTVKTLKYANEHRIMTVGALYAANFLQAAVRVGFEAGQHGILSKAAKNRQAAYEAGKFAVKTLSATAAKVNYAKMAKGAYKITTMA